MQRLQIGCELAECWRNTESYPAVCTPPGCGDSMVTARLSLVSQEDPGPLIGWGAQTTPAPLPPPGRMRYAASAGVRPGPDPDTSWSRVTLSLVSGQASVPLNPRQLHHGLHPNRKFPEASFYCSQCVLSSPNIVSADIWVPRWPVTRRSCPHVSRPRGFESCHDQPWLNPSRTFREGFRRLGRGLLSGRAPWRVRDG